MVVVVPYDFWKIMFVSRNRMTNTQIWKKRTTEWNLYSGMKNAFDGARALRCMTIFVIIISFQNLYLSKKGFKIWYLHQARRRHDPCSQAHGLGQGKNMKFFGLSRPALMSSSLAQQSFPWAREQHVQVYSWVTFVYVYEFCVVYVVFEVT